MTDFTLKEVAEAFAAIDGIAPGDRPAFEKFLRNLTQRHRHAVRPTGKRWRADTFSLETIAALRLVEMATRADLPRLAVQDLAVSLKGSLTGVSGTVAVKGGWRGLSLIEEAVQRTRAGETFDIHIDMIAYGQHRIAPDWEPAHWQEASEEERRAAERILAHADPVEPALIRMTLRASRMIAALLHHLQKG